MSIKKARKTLQNKEKFNYDILDKVANSGRKSIVRVDVICCFMQINEGRDLLDRNQVLSVD